MVFSKMWRNLFAVFFLKLCLCYCVASEGVTWNDFMRNAKWATNELAGKLEPYILQNYPFNNVSEICTKSLNLYANGLKEWEPWAIKMFDATGKFPSGFLSGTNLELGSFDDCIEVNAKFSDLSKSFKGQYCIISLKTSLIYPLNRKTSSGKSYVEAHGYPPEWIANMMEEHEGLLSKFGLYVGTCTPSTCSEQDLYNIVFALTKPADLKVSLSDCQVDEPRKWPITAKIAIFLIFLLFGVCVLGTVLDIRDRKKEEENLQCNESFNRKSLKAFSLYTNSEKLFEVKKTTNSLDSINGIRFWMCVWIVFGHTFMYPNRWKEIRFTNFLHLLEVLTPATVLAENAVINVEDFFVISGFLMTYTLWTKLEKSGGKIKITEILLQKYWRLTPAHVFTIILTFAVPVLYNGPIWNSTWEEETEKCANYGWMNLFYIQNFLDQKNICGIHTWYIGALMQIQTVSLLLLVLTYKYPKAGITVGLLIISGAIIHDFNYLVSEKMLLPAPSSLKDFDVILDIVSKMYVKPFHHFVSHAIGMLLGWIVLKYKDRKLHWACHVVGWTLSSIVSAVVLLAIKSPTKNVVLAGLYTSLRPLFWSLSFSWLVYTCTTGSAGVLGKFLSFKFLVPFSQVSYFVYLLHPLLIILRDASLRQRTYMAKIPQFIDFLALAMASFLLAFIAYLTVEAPSNIIYDLWKKRKSSESSTEYHEHIVIKSAENGKITEKEL